MTTKTPRVGAPPGQVAPHNCRVEKGPGSGIGQARRLRVCHARTGAREGRESPARVAGNSADLPGLFLTLTMGRVIV
ncbi:hypothetical protein DAERI_070058 [Deinococcus aerius]|uniref:Uncharacterized protein n=1 Tax=Deinococcus aerius TaxID=200253 RepID=A0A2I9D6J7_9DEIO|nr:hypothetical protein DAERI_070058 [Deinococcus aerius]